MKMGEFLVSKGVVTKYDIVAALKQQRLMQQPIGRVAIRHGCLTINQVFDLLRLQTDRENSHFLFGNLAVELGYMDETQYHEIRQLQTSTSPDLIDVLLQLNMLSEVECRVSGQEFAALSSNLSR